MSNLGLFGLSLLGLRSSSLPAMAVGVGITPAMASVVPW